MTTTYDDNNIFAKILRGEIPCDKVYEDEYVLAFNDINPLAKTHVLIIPKGKYVSWHDFSQNAPNEEISAFIRATAKIAQDLNIAESGYRTISNHGKNGNQEVPHFHLHLIGGNFLGRMLSDTNAKS